MLEKKKIRTRPQNPKNQKWMFERKKTLEKNTHTHTHIKTHNINYKREKIRAVHAIIFFV